MGAVTKCFIVDKMDCCFEAAPGHSWRLVFEEHPERHTLSTQKQQELLQQQRNRLRAKH